jgi:hypothetical protein
MDMESTQTQQPVKKKRGRKPGSKNKPKPATTESKEVASLPDVSQHVQAINHLAKKMEDYEDTILGHMREIKKARPDDYKKIIEEELNIGRSRKYKLLAITDGRKTLAEVRAAGAKRQSEKRKREKENESVTSRTRTEGNGDASADAHAEPKEGNGQAPIDMGARFAELDAKETVEEAEAAVSAAVESRDPRKYQDTLYNKVCSLVGTMDEETRKKLILHLVDTYGRPDDYPRSS